MPTHYKGNAAEIRALDAYIKLVRAADTVTGKVREQITAFGLTEPQFAVLEALHHVGPLRASDLAKKLLRIEKSGLVARRACTADRRVTYVDLTAAGRDRVKRIFPAVAGRITGLLAALDPAEQEQLGRLARKLGISCDLRSGSASDSSSSKD
jgi:MarR family transcriptional regulator, 2-MHQ and catechol-resistance regulon repressor